MKGQKKSFYIGNLRGFLLHTVSSSNSFSRKTFLFFLIYKRKRAIPRHKDLLGLLERNDSTLINKKAFKHPLEFQQKFESQLFLIATSPFRQRRGGGHKRKKPGGALFSQAFRASLSSPLRCLTSVFGMVTGVTTAPSPPDFFHGPMPSEHWILSLNMLQPSIF